MEEELGSRGGGVLGIRVVVVVVRFAELWDSGWF